jgi:hypothetical protein
VQQGTEDAAHRAGLAGPDVGGELRDIDDLGDVGGLGYGVQWGRDYPGGADLEQRGLGCDQDLAAGQVSRNVTGQGLVPS